jgi:hypothetical protein
VAENMFMIRFLNAHTIQEWEGFNPIRCVKAKVRVDPWSGAVGAKEVCQP